MTWLYVTGLIIVLLGMSAFFGAPYVPSRHRDVRRMFDELAPVGGDDVVLDLGSGDGLVLREVRRRGAKAVGYEIHPFFYGISRWLSWGDKHTTIKLTNIWTEKFPADVTLVYIFSVHRDGARVVRLMQKETNRLKKPIRVVCYGNALPGVRPLREFEAYYLYEFRPLHLKEA